MDLRAMPLRKWFRGRRPMILSLLIFGAAGLSCMLWFVARFLLWNLKPPNFIRKLSLERTGPLQEFQRKSKISLKKFLSSIQAKESRFNKLNSINGGGLPIINLATAFTGTKKFFLTKKSWTILLLWDSIETKLLKVFKKMNKTKKLEHTTF